MDKNFLALIAGIKTLVINNDIIIRKALASGGIFY